MILQSLTYINADTYLSFSPISKMRDDRVFSPVQISFLYSKRNEENSKYSKTIKKKKKKNTISRINANAHTHIYIPHICGTSTVMKDALRMFTLCL